MPKSRDDTMPWERQKGESEKAFEAFALYRDMGTDRTITAVVNELGKSRSLIDRWKDRWKWKERVKEYDVDNDRKAKKAVEKSITEMYSRQTKIALQIQAKALEALNTLDPKDMSIRDIKEYIKMATDLERLTRVASAPRDEQPNSSQESKGETGESVSFDETIDLSNLSEEELKQIEHISAKLAGQT